MDFELPDAKTAQEQSKVQEGQLNKIIIERMEYFIPKINNNIKQAIDSGKFNRTVSIPEMAIYKILSRGNEQEYAMFSRFATPLYITNISLKEYYTDKGYTFSADSRESFGGIFIDIEIGWE